MSVTCISIEDLELLLSNISYNDVCFLIKKTSKEERHYTYYLNTPTKQLRKDLLESLRVPSGPGTGNLAEHHPPTTDPQAQEGGSDADERPE